MNDGKPISPEDRRLNRLLDVLEPPPPSDLLRARVEKALVTGARRFDRGARTSGPGGAARMRIAAAIVLAAAAGVASWMPAPGGGPTTAGLVPAPDRVPWTAAESIGDSGDGIALVGVGGGNVGGVALVRAAWDEPAAGTVTNVSVIEDDFDLIPLD